MLTEESIRLLQTVHKIAFVREVEPLISLILRTAQSIAGARETVLTILHEGTDTALWFDANGQRTAVLLDTVTASSCARLLRNSGPSRLERNGNTLILQLHPNEQTRGAIVLHGSAAASDQSQLAALMEFVGYASASIGIALTFERMVARIRFLENHDLLTKLPNRIFFRRQLSESLDAAGDADSLALLFIDLDRFKDINREFGHAVGDAALRQVAQRMSVFSETRGLPYLPARIGGDEFALIVRQRVGLPPVDELANALLKDLRTPLKIGPLTSSIAASAGIASSPPTGATVEELMRTAERAMYKAKVLGGDQCFRL